MSECVGLHSTCHAASLRRLCIRAHGFSNSLMRVEAEPLLSLWVGGRGRCGLARGSSWTQESPCLVWASPAPSSASPWKGPAPRPPPLSAVCGKASKDDHSVPPDGLSFSCTLALGDYDPGTPGQGWRSCHKRRPERVGPPPSTPAGADRWAQRREDRVDSVPSLGRPTRVWWLTSSSEKE